MKRYRLLTFSFDTRIEILNMDIKEEWDSDVKKSWKLNKQKIVTEYTLQYGSYNFEKKLKNISDLGRKNFSLIAFHNKFQDQIRNAFICENYYPALTGCCTLGERILNHLILNLRDNFKGTNEYKKIYRKSSFDSWDIVIDILEKWNIFNKEVVLKYRNFKDIRNRAIHFNPEIDTNDRELALEAIILIDNIINCQFGVNVPWTFMLPGEFYIKKDYEKDVFVKNIIIPRNNLYVGYKHKVKNIYPLEIIDDTNYDNKDITDEEFINIRKKYNNRK